MKWVSMTSTFIKAATYEVKMLPEPDALLLKETQQLVFN